MGNKGTVPDTIIREKKAQEIEVDDNNNDISLSQVPELLNAQTSALWELYEMRKKSKMTDQEIERRSHVCSSKYKDWTIHSKKYCDI